MAKKIKDVKKKKKIFEKNADKKAKEVKEEKKEKKPVQKKTSEEPEAFVETFKQGKISAPVLEQIAREGTPGFISRGRTEDEEEKGKIDYKTVGKSDYATLTPANTGGTQNKFQYTETSVNYKEMIHQTPEMKETRRTVGMGDIETNPNNSSRVMMEGKNMIETEREKAEENREKYLTHTDYK
ncbi:MAG: hypothetical protein ABIH49_00760 [archaeon]